MACRPLQSRPPARAEDAKSFVGAATSVKRIGAGHRLVQGLGSDAERVELALRAVSRAVGEAARKHPANEPASPPWKFG